MLSIFEEIEGILEERPVDKVIVNTLAIFRALRACHTSAENFVLYMEIFKKI